MAILSRLLSGLIESLPDPSPTKAKQEQEQAESIAPNRLSLQFRPSAEDQARPANRILIRLGEQVTGVGMTGSGKTYFAIKGLLEYMRRQYPMAKRYIIDSTADPDIPDMVHAPLIVKGNNPPGRLRDAAYTMIWTPDNSKIPASYAKFFDMLNDAREPTILIVDEIASITAEAMDALETLLKQFRKHGGTAICLTQQIASVDQTLFRQMSHFFQFLIQNEVYDQSRARSYLNLSKEEHHAPRWEHGFFHRRTRGIETAREYRDMRDFFGHFI